MERSLLLKRKQASKLEIDAPDSYSGKSFKINALYNGAQCPPVWSIIAGESYATINQNGKIDINSLASQSTITVQAVYKTKVETKNIVVTYTGDLQIVCPDTITGDSGTFYVLYDSTDVTESCDYTVISGSAEVLNGSIQFEESEIFIFQATYNSLSVSKAVTLIYDSNTRTETVIDPVTGDTTTTTTTEVTNPTTGETTTTETVVVENTDGSITTTQTETVTQNDGSSETNSTTTNSDGTSSSTTTTTSTPDPETGAVTTETTTTNYNENGDPTSSTETTTVENTDGSSTSQTTNYNSEGDPTSTQNQETDTDGNESVQNITYDSNGDPIVSGYNIDTTNNPDGEKNFNEEGVNTEFYGFDEVDGFIMRIHFTMDFTNQPANQNEGHHNILSMKRASPSPWYGFQLRQSNTTKSIILGTQFEFGSNTNTTIQPSWVETNKVGEYDIQVVYDPTLFQNTFVCTNLLTNTQIYSSNYLFPDLPELRYLTVCIGCALDENNEPYRYSNINVLDFELNKIQRELSNPLITCDGQSISLSCLTPGSNIYYRLNQTGSYIQYTEPISIYSDTVVQTYSTLYDQQSETVTQLCVYDDGLEEPVINCDGESVDISCATPSVDIYYRLGTSGNWILYESPIEINATTVVQAYSEIDSHQSEIVEETCVYVPVVLAAPVISYSDNVIEISCSTIRAQIYYRLNQEGTFSLYEGPITITEDTYVETYSTYKNQTSITVTENCEYVPDHDYSQDYLTFRVLTSGTILWKAIGTGYTRTIEYSINNSSWTSWTSTSAGAAINVSENDVIRLRGSNTTYAKDKSNYSGFDGGTATYDVEGNIHSLLYGDNFSSNSSLTNSTYQFCSIFKQSGVHSAENLILPALSLTKYCYRAMFSKAYGLITPPALPATTLAEGCYYYMFEECAFEVAPDLLAATILRQSYYYMFTSCRNLNFIRCLATSGVTYANCQGWTTNVSGNGVFIKDGNTTWTLDSASGIPIGWTVYNDVLIYAPNISFDGETIELSCQTPEMNIYYRLDGTGNFLLYSSPITIAQDTDIESYATDGTHNSPTSTMSCTYAEETIYEQSNKDLTTWTYAGNTITTPYSVNRIDGHSSNYAKGTFNFETSVNLRAEQPTYLWFQHADQSADIYVDNVLVETHWGGYNAFFSDITNYIHRGTNHIKVALCNTTRSTLAPAAGDFNFNATLGNVKLFTSPYLPDMSYGYDGMHITSSISRSTARIDVTTNIPSGADVYFKIMDGERTVYSTSARSTGQEMTFSTSINNVHLWHGTEDPYLYDVILEIYANNELYHRYVRPYGFRTYEYVINQSGIVENENYTGFLLNGEPYLLRGVCMHDDLDGKANALNDSDYEQEFSIIQELGCNFIRLAHYPHPKEVYDRCDALGIIVQTEVPCVNKLQSTMPADYYIHLTGQYRDMVNQHYNHPCIMFWGLSNETSTDDKTFGKSKVEEYTSLIKSLDSERWVGYVLSHSYNNPLGYYNDPDVDWVGGNIYVGWYIDKASNNPTSQLNTRINNTVNRLSKPFAFSEYGCGGTPTCHSDDFMNTTTTGNYARHDIEYQMWLHEGHIASIRNFPQLLFTSQWQLFDIAVSNRNEGYTECLDGETTSTNNALRRLNNKGLVERDHIHKKDTFYIYKAEWSSEQFVHICGKNYTKMLDRVIKCYTNAGDSASLYVNNTLVENAAVSNHIVEFTKYNFSSRDIVRVDVGSYSDTFTFE